MRTRSNTRQTSRLPRKPSSAKLREEIDAVQNEIAQLSAQIDQAEAACIDASADESRYIEASAAAAQLAQARAVKAQRLERLNAALDDATGREQDAEIERLAEEEVKAKAEGKRIAIECRDELEAENKRHEDAVAEIEARTNKVTTALHGVHTALKDARDRMAECNKSRIVELREQAREVGKNLGVNSADSVTLRVREIEKQIAGLKYHLEDETNDAAREDYERRIELARQTLAPLKEQEAALVAEHEKLNAEANALAGV